MRMPSDLLSVRRPWSRGIHLIPLPQMIVPGGPPIDRFDLLPERFQPRQAWDPTVAGPILGARASSGSSHRGVDYQATLDSSPLDRQQPIPQSIIPPRELLNGAKPKEIPSRPHRSPGKPSVSEVVTIFDHVCRRKKAKEKIEEWRQACREQGKKWLVERTLPSPHSSSSSQQEKPLSTSAPPPRQKLARRAPPSALALPPPGRARRKVPNKAPDEGELEGELEVELEGELMRELLDVLEGVELEGEPNSTVSHEDEELDEELVARSRTSTPPEYDLDYDHPQACQPACQQGSLLHGDRHGRDDAQKPIATIQKAPPPSPPPPPPPPPPPQQQPGLHSPHFLEGAPCELTCELMQLRMQLGSPTAPVGIPPEDHWELMQLCITNGAELEQAEDDEWEIMQLCIQAAPEDPWEIMQLCIQAAPEDPWEIMQLCIQAAPEDPWEIMQLCIQAAAAAPPEDPWEIMQLCLRAARSKVNLNS